MGRTSHPPSAPFSQQVVNRRHEEHYGEDDRHGNGSPERKVLEQASASKWERGRGCVHRGYCTSDLLVSSCPHSKPDGGLHLLVVRCKGPRLALEAMGLQATATTLSSLYIQELRFQLINQAHRKILLRSGLHSRAWAFSLRIDRDYPRPV